MDQKTKIAVIGGGGRTGNYLVSQLLNQGFFVKLLLRNPEKIQKSFSSDNPLIEIVKGDVLDFKVVKYLIENCDAVISTVGQRKGEPLVASRATTNILKAITENMAPGLGKQRYILVAGLNVDTPFDKKGADTLAATEWMKANFPEIHKDRQKAYAILTKSDAEWTLVRVPFIEFTEARKPIQISLEDAAGTKIGAADIAGFLIDQIKDQNYIRKAPFISNIG